MSARRTPNPPASAPFNLRAVKVTPRNITFDRVTFDGFVNFAAKLGLGAPNQLSAGHWTFGPFLSRNRTELEAMYRSNWIAGQVVDAIAEDMTRAGAQIVSSNTPEEIEAVNRDIDRLKIWHHLCNTIKWSRLFGGAIAVLLIDGQNLQTPLRLQSVGRDSFRGLLVLDRWLLWPSYSDLITDYGPEMGQPKYYDVIGDAAALPNARVHHSRVCRFDGIELPYYQKMYENGWGLSELERMHDRLIAFDSVTMGAAQLVFKAYLRVIGVKGLRSALSMGGKAEDAVIKQFEYIRMMQTNEGITLTDSDDTFATHQYAFSGLADVMMQFGEQISGSAKIPLVRLFGQSPAGLNSTGESDLRNYYDTIRTDQENHLRPALVKIYAVQSMSTLGKPLPEDFSFTFNPLWQMMDKDKAEVAKVVADAVNEAVNAGIMSRQMALKELRQISISTGIFTNITDEDIAAADNEVHEMGEGTGETLGFGARETKGAALDAEWEEAEHPRVQGGERGGEFTSGGGSGAAPKAKVPASQLRWEHLDAQAQQKYRRVAAMNHKFDAIKKENYERIDKDERAACLALIMSTGIRPGSEKDMHAKKKAYGATTLEGRHIVQENGVVRLRFTGKKGVDLNLPVRDPEIAKMLLERKRKAGEEGQLFQTKEDKLSAYVHGLDGGGFKTKDFRTHLGTSTAVSAIQTIEAPKTEKEYRQKVMEVARRVSAVLGNTPVVALQAYINPMIFLNWRRGVGA